MPGMPYKIMSIVTRKLEGVKHFHYYLCRQLKGGGMEIFMKLTEKKKKYLAVCGGIIICAGLITAIAFQFRTESPEGEAAETAGDAVTEIVVNPSDSESQPEESGESELVVNPENDKTEADDTAPPVDSRPAQTDETEQSIQPDGTPVEDVPETSGEAAPETSTSEPQAGDTEGGQIYIPGFGWVDNQGGGSSGTSAGDMYENGNKIGSMD